VFAAFEERVLPFDAKAAMPYAMIVSDRDRAGRPIDGLDAQITSICRGHGAALATRNSNDFQAPGLTSSTRGNQTRTLPPIPTRRAQKLAVLGGIAAELGATPNQGGAGMPSGRPSAGDRAASAADVVA
jgi:hypothetical protein